MSCIHTCRCCKWFCIIGIIICTRLPRKIWLSHFVGLLATTNECPTPAPMSLILLPWNDLEIMHGKWTLVSFPVPHIPCSFQPNVNTSSLPGIKRAQSIATSCYYITLSDNLTIKNNSMLWSTCYLHKINTIGSHWIIWLLLCDWFLLHDLIITC